MANNGDLDVSWTGVKEIQGKIKLLQERAEKATKNAVNEHALNIQAAAKKNITDLPAVDTGLLRSSIKIENYSTGGYAAKVGTDVNYAKAIEYGQRPHFPPLDPIREWCRRHGIPESMAFVIARKIAKTGQPAKPFLFPAFESERRNFVDRINSAWQDIVGGIVE
jgi:HK97 gp10 family phage protein